MITPALSLPPGMGMNYSSEVFDRKTGELVSVDQGDWITMAELGELLGIGRRRLTTVLRELDFIQIEGGGKNARHRIQDWVISKGYGKRNRRKSDNQPFDVLSPEGVRWIAHRWQGAKTAIEDRTTVPIKDARAALRDFQLSRSKPMCGQEEICWLADHFPHFTHEQIAQALELSRQLVTRLMKRRENQLANARLLKALYR